MSLQKGWQVLVKLRRGLVMGALHGGHFQSAAHVFNLAVGPGVRGLGQVVPDPGSPANTRSTPYPPGKHWMGLQGEPHALVGRGRMGFTWKFLRYPPQKVCGNWARGPQL